LGFVNELDSSLLNTQADPAGVSASGATLFLLPLSRSSSLTHCEQRIGKKRGWRSRLLGLSSPARTPTRRSPHGVRKLIRNAPLGQSLFTAARRPWTLFVVWRRSGGAFFCGQPGDLAQLGAPQGGVVFARGRDVTPAADETLLERREGTLWTAALAKVRRLASKARVWQHHARGHKNRGHVTQGGEAWPLRGWQLGLAGWVAEPAWLWPLCPLSPGTVYLSNKDITN
jgi:hypothetical protein